MVNRSNTYEIPGIAGYSGFFQKESEMAVLTVDRLIEELLT